MLAGCFLTSCNSVRDTLEPSIRLASVVAPITATPEPGRYLGLVEITLQSEPGATLYYTCDNTLPNRRSTRYSGPFTITETTEIYAFAAMPDRQDSELFHARYTLVPLPVIPSVNHALKPTVIPAGGSFSSPVAVQLTLPQADAVIFYTLNGTAPTLLSDQYLPGISPDILITRTATLRARAWPYNGLPGDEVLCEFAIDQNSVNGD